MPIAVYCVKCGSMLAGTQGQSAVIKEAIERIKKLEEWLAQLKES